MAELFDSGTNWSAFSTNDSIGTHADWTYAENNASAYIQKTASGYMRCVAGTPGSTQYYGGWALLDGTGMGITTFGEVLIEVVDDNQAWQFPYGLFHLGMRVESTRDAVNSDYGWQLTMNPGFSNGTPDLYRQSNSGNGTRIVDNFGTWSNSAQWWLRWRVENTAADEWTHSIRRWTGTLGSEPGIWDETYVDTAPGTADDHSPGYFWISYDVRASTTGPAYVDIGNLTVWNADPSGTPPTQITGTCSMQFTAAGATIDTPTHVTGTSTMQFTAAGDIIAIAPAQITGTASMEFTSAGNIDSEMGDTGANIFSEPFTDISAGADIDEDGRWEINRYLSTTGPKESSGWSQWLPSGGTIASLRARPDTTSYNLDEKGELTFTLDQSNITASRYSKFAVAIRGDYWGQNATAGTENTNNDLQPARGWWLETYAGRPGTTSCSLRRGYYAGNGQIGSTTWADNQTVDFMRVRVQWEKTGTSEFTIRVRLWERGTAEPGTWDIEATDTNATAQAPASGWFGFSTTQWFGTAIDHLIDDIRVNNMSDGTAVSGTASSEFTAAGNVTTAAVPPPAQVTGSCSMEFTAAGAPIAATAGTTQISGTVAAEFDVSGHMGLLRSQVDLEFSTAGPVLGNLYFVDDPGAGDTLGESYNAGIGAATIEAYTPGLDAHWWEPANARAIMIFATGGSYASCDPASIPEHFKDRYNHGDIVCSIDYRTAQDGAGAPAWDNPLQDVLTAVSWAQAKWPGLPVVLAGHSAGAHLMTHAADRLNLPALLIASWTWWSEMGHGFWVDIGRNNLFGDTSDGPADAQVNWSTSTPNTYWVYGTGDTVVPTVNTVNSVHRLNEAIGMGGPETIHLDVVDTGTDTDHDPYGDMNMTALETWWQLQVGVGITGEASMEFGASGTITVQPPGTTTIDGAWKPTTKLTNVDAWLDANESSSLTMGVSGTTVKSWADRSGHAYANTWDMATSSKQPALVAAGLNGRQAIQFDGVDDYLKETDPVLDSTLTDTRTVAVVAKFDQTTGSGAIIEKALNTTTGSGVRWRVRRDGTKLEMYGYGESGEADAGADHAASWFVFVGEITGAGTSQITSKAWIDGVLVGTEVGASLASRHLYNDNPSYLGVRASANGTGPDTTPWYFDGMIGEIVALDNTLTEQEREELEGHLAHKWELESVLPAEHPYKITSPDSLICAAMEFTAAGAPTATPPTPTQITGTVGLELTAGADVDAPPEPAAQVVGTAAAEFEVVGGPIAQIPGQADLEFIASGDITAIAPPPQQLPGDVFVEFTATGEVQAGRTDIDGLASVEFLTGGDVTSIVPPGAAVTGEAALAFTTGGEPVAPEEGTTQITGSCSIEFTAAADVTAGSTLFIFEAYTNDEPGDGATIATCEPDGSNVTHLTTPGLYRDHWPRVSPDGTRIMFGRDPKGVLGNTPLEIWVMNVDGTNPTRIMSLTPGDKQNDENSYGEWGHHEWIDDNTIVFGADAAADATFAIWKCNADGTGHVRLTDGTVPGCIDPSVNPATGEIMFIRGSLPGNQEIWKMNPDGTNETQISSDSWIDFDPYVSPDGTRIVNLVADGLFGDCVLRDIDGSNRQVLVDGFTQGAHGVSRWVTDDQIISSRVGANGRELILIDPDSGSYTIALASTPTAKYRDVEVFVRSPAPTQLFGTCTLEIATAGAPIASAPGATDITGSSNLQFATDGSPNAYGTTPVSGEPGDIEMDFVCSGTVTTITPPAPVQITGTVTVDLTALGTVTATPPGPTDITGTVELAFTTAGTVELLATLISGEAAAEFDVSGPVRTAAPAVTSLSGDLDLEFRTRGQLASGGSSVIRGARLIGARYSASLAGARYRRATLIGPS